MTRRGRTIYVITGYCGRCNTYFRTTSTTRRTSIPCPKCGRLVPVK